MTSEENKKREAEAGADLPETEEDLKPEEACKNPGEKSGEKSGEKPGEKEEKQEQGAAEAGQKQVAEKEPEEELNAKYMRLMADFQNFKRRTEKEKSDIYAFANEKIVKELLDVIDNFERAIAAGTGGDKFLEGMEMILKQLLAVLERAGVTEIKCLGEDFDPNFHNAVMTEDSAQYESGKVIEVLQKGYILNSRLVRPAMVKVSN